MFQTGCDRYLVAKALRADGLRHLGSKHLERDEPVVFGVPRQKHGGHSATRQFALHDVGVAERRL